MLVLVMFYIGVCCAGSKSDSGLQMLKTGVGGGKRAEYEHTRPAIEEIVEDIILASPDGLIPPGQEPHLTPKQLHSLHLHLDGDGDGLLTREEVLAHEWRTRRPRAQALLGDVLGRMDKDNDGKVSLREYAQGRESGYSLEAATFKAADVDMDGRLNEDELLASWYPEADDAVAQAIAFDTMRRHDLDDDFRLSLDEFVRNTVEGLETHEGSDNPAQDFVRLDSDSDGHLGLNELMPWGTGQFLTELRVDGLFALADVDRDKHLTVAELVHQAEALKASDARYHLYHWADHAGI
eukprot:TRINITY_DN13085_c0_g3_i1.p1 TRINITY_DN13085_c0_g3~~TRINITY_DN13085_c0_g3_i1.p1  ORF type:complete len:294 (+),score=53.09 TRINITY_DN13085_c0_g3_i1:91-972(+)